MPKQTTEVDRLVGVRITALRNDAEPGRRFNHDTRRADTPRSGLARPSGQDGGPGAIFSHVSSLGEYALSV
jgi:hypothetical protein